MINRRTFMADAALLGTWGLGRLLGGAAAPTAAPPVSYTIRALTTGPKHHFFGYYGICPWNRSGKYLVCLESAFQDRMPEPEEAAAIGLVDAETGQFKQVGETRGWNLQHGATLQQSLLIYDMETRQGLELCRYGMKEKKYISGNVRCDFHPRWNRQGDQICFDAIEPRTWTRQLHVVHVKGL